MNVLTLYSILLGFQLGLWCGETKNEITVNYGEHQQTFKKNGFLYPEVLVINKNVIIIRLALSSRDLVIQNYYIFNVEENKGTRLNYTTFSTNHFITKYEDKFQLYENYLLKETTHNSVMLQNWIQTKLKELREE